MQEVFEKIKESLEEDRRFALYEMNEAGVGAGLERAIEIVNQVAEEYCKPKLTPEQRDACWAHSSKDCSKCGQCYVPDINVGSNDGWIPVSERLPEDGDCGFYMCIVENHEEDLPMFCQFEEEYGFGFRHDIYDEHTLGFVDSEFRTNEELGYEKVIAWQPLPAPYKPKGENNAEIKP